MKDDEWQFDEIMAAVRRLFDGEEFQQAAKLCAKACEMQPDSSIAHANRMFALLSCSKWADALKVCDGFAGDEQFMTFERAYCLYRLNKFSDALSALQKGDGDDPRNRTLEAQILYRMGEYAECAQMYEQMYEDNAEETGPLVNALASRVSGGEPRQAKKLMASNEELLASSYELCFNLACAHIEEGELDEAESKLEDARRICINELLAAEELPEEDAEKFKEHEEVTAINVQRACVLHRRGTAEAREQASGVYARMRRLHLLKGKADPGAVAVASNNEVALRLDGADAPDLPDLRSRLQVAAKEARTHRLNRKQMLDIGVNRFSLLMREKRKGDARRLIAELSQEFPGHPRIATMQAALDYHGKLPVAEGVFQAHLKDHPGNEEALICLAHLYGTHKKHSEAADALSQLPQRSRARPHVVEALAALHRSVGHPDKAVACLREAIDYWVKEDGGDDVELAAVLRTTWRVGRDLKDRALAAEAFKLYVERIDGSDTQALCGLVHELAGSDPERAEEYAQRLRPPDYGHLDPEELEALPISQVKGADEASRKKKAKAAASDEASPKPEASPKDGEKKKGKVKEDKSYVRGSQGIMPTDDNAFRNKGPSTAQIDLAKDTGSRPKGGRKAKGKK